MKHKTSGEDLGFLIYSKVYYACRQRLQEMFNNEQKAANNEATTIL